MQEAVPRSNARVASSIMIGLLQSRATSAIARRNACSSSFILFSRSFVDLSSVGLVKYWSGITGSNVVLPKFYHCRQQSRRRCGRANNSPKFLPNNADKIGFYRIQIQGLGPLRRLLGGSLLVTAERSLFRLLDSNLIRCIRAFTARQRQAHPA